MHGMTKAWHRLCTAPLLCTAPRLPECPGRADTVLQSRTVSTAISRAVQWRSVRRPLPANWATIGPRAFVVCFFPGRSVLFFIGTVRSPCRGGYCTAWIGPVPGASARKRQLSGPVLAAPRRAAPSRTGRDGPGRALSRVGRCRDWTDFVYTCSRACRLASLPSTHGQTRARRPFSRTKRNSQTALRGRPDCAVRRPYCTVQYQSPIRLLCDPV